MVKDIVIGAGGLGFHSRAGQIVHSRQRFATAATFFRNCVAQAPRAEIGPDTRYALRRSECHEDLILIFLKLKKLLAQPYSD